MREIRPDWCKKYDGAGGANEGLAWVKLNGKYGFVNLKGEEVIPPKYDDVGFFHENFASFKLNGKWGLVNTEGKEVIAPKYDSREEAREHKP